MQENTGLDMSCACLYDLMSHSALLEASLYLTAGRWEHGIQSDTGAEGGGRQCCLGTRSH